MIKLTFIQILFYFRSCRPCLPHWRSADAVLFFSFLSPQDCGDLQPTAPRWDGRRVPALRRSRRGRWSRLTLCCLISSSGEVDQTDRRGYHRGPAAHRGGCGHRGHVRVPSSETELAHLLLLFPLILLLIGCFVSGLIAFSLQPPALSPLMLFFCVVPDWLFSRCPVSLQTHVFLFLFIYLRFCCFCSSFWPSSVWFYTLVSSSFDFDAHPCIVLGQLVSTFFPN